MTGTFTGPSVRKSLSAFGPIRGRARATILGTAMLASIIFSSLSITPLPTVREPVPFAVPISRGYGPSSALVHTTSGPNPSGAIQRPAMALLGNPMSSTSSSAEWVNISAGLSNAPPPRSNASVAWDGADGYYLLFGGEHAGSILGDTWRFQDGSWTEVYSSKNPAPRFGAGMAYDAIDHYVVMFGGNNKSGTINDTWAFSGGQWTHLKPSAPPRGRLFPSMAYDGNLSEVILFGGLLPNNQSAATWEFSGGQWTQANIGGPNQPADRVGGIMVYDPVSQELVMFGGWDPEALSALVLNDTWVYVSNSTGPGGHWSRDNGTTGPTPRSGAAAAFDATDDAVVLFGGTTAAGYSLSDTWEWRGGTWVNVTGSLGISPTARSGATMAASTLPGLSPNASLLAPLLLGGWSSSTSIPSGVWFFGSLPLSVLPPLLNPPALDEGIPGTFTAMAFGGNTTSYSYSWNGLPSSCASTNSSIIHCTSSATGVFGLSVNVTDASLSQRRSGLSNWTVNPPPIVTQFTALPSPITQGSQLFVTVKVSGGTAPYTFQYSGLPAGCGFEDTAQFNCTPDFQGSYTLSVQAIDSDSLRAPIATTLLVVTTPPSTHPAPWQVVVEVFVVLVAAVVAIIIVRRKIRQGRAVVSTPANTPNIPSPPATPPHQATSPTSSEEPPDKAVPKA